MTSLKALAGRPAFGATAPRLLNPQRRWAQVHDVRFLVTHQQNTRAVDKYRDKLQRKAKESVIDHGFSWHPTDRQGREGLKDVDELKAAYQSKIESQRKKALTSAASAVLDTPDRTPTSPPSQSTSPYPAPPPPPQPASASTSPSTPKTGLPPGVKTLSSYIDLDKTLQLPQREIEYLWRLRHASDEQSLCAVIPNTTYSRIESTARRHPQFILPLPREGKGAEIHFLQWTFPTPTTATVLFTHLAEFKLRGEFAQPHTTVTHHLDLREEKGLVLLQGAVVEGRGLTVDEAKWLLMCLQKFYGGEGEQPAKRRLLESFSGGDEGFKVEELLEEAEKIV